MGPWRLGGVLGVYIGTRAPNSEHLSTFSCIQKILIMPASENRSFFWARDPSTRDCSLLWDMTDMQ